MVNHDFASALTTLFKFQKAMTYVSKIKSSFNLSPWVDLFSNKTYVTSIGWLFEYRCAVNHC